MGFSWDDIKVAAEVASPVLAGVWYIRGALVKITNSVEHLRDSLHGMKEDFKEVPDRLTRVETRLSERTRHHTNPNFPMPQWPRDDSE